LAEALGHGARHRLVTVGKQFQVGAGREEFAAAAGDHQRVDIALGIQVCHQFGQCGQAVQRPGVRGWVVQRDDGGVLASFSLQIGVA
jgi:hypothetical protein